MAVFDFSGLGKGALAALPAITGFVAQGIESPSAILEAVRSAGFKIRTQTGLDIIGALQGNLSSARAIRLTPLSAPLNPEFYGTKLTKTATKYSYQVRGTFRSEDGYTNSQFVTVVSNEALSQDQIMAVGETYLSGYDAFNAENELVSMQVTLALSNPE